ncbi:aa3-type cytochrome c oxidase subunit IV [Gymnodinialimonas ceratoperidinii]|uniref:Aa3-type cytochrome c oxidase subunit IV n=1 Tax=Gymnodinialimonas ceratoperidinii TaxID=2856823 RepID=A0A8F6TZ26_9RHOB|nr:aa3-type cytochrome c oxidase subunit IV [Gymnodinialimonas ceratoperidinii]QXT40351.1 aa3-type cytochrome c oxidase subunit IV [Gymnodinialimonas ceratoperidinii]
MADHDDYKHGEMDITEQEKAFAGFMKMSTNVAIFSILVLIFLAIFAS